MISSEYDSIQIFTSGRVFEISDNYVGGKPSLTCMSG
jgi:hypothetical protein